jgi:hypothetical protein
MSCETVLSRVAGSPPPRWRATPRNHEAAPPPAPSRPPVGSGAVSQKQQNQARSCIGAHFRCPVCFFPFAAAPMSRHHVGSGGSGAIMSCRIRASLRFAVSDAPCPATTRSRRSASTTPHKQTHHIPRAHVLPVLPRYLSPAPLILIFQVSTRATIIYYSKIFFF